MYRHPSRPTLRFSTILTFAAVWLLPGAGSTHSLSAQDSAEVDAARTAAGQYHLGQFYRRCQVPGGPAPFVVPAAPAGMPEWYARPAQVFDNLYFLGTRSLNSYAITTSEGIVILDPMFDYNIDLAVVDGLEQLGLDPTDISHVIVSHGHGDHYGGASQLQQDYGAEVLLSAADWDLMLASGGSQPKPGRDRVVEDGEVLTVGDTRFQFTLTPGHTPGTISTIFPVYDQGEAHVAAIWGGTGMPEETYEEYAASARKFEEAMRAAGSDVIVGNHGDHDQAHLKIATLSDRREGDSHPYVIGTEATANYVRVMRECALANLARLPSR